MTKRTIGHVIPEPGLHPPLIASHFPSQNPQDLCFFSARCFFVLLIKPLEFELTEVYFSFLINKTLTVTISNELWAQKPVLRLLWFHYLPCQDEEEELMTSKFSSGSDILKFWFLFNYFTFGSTYPKGASSTPSVSCVRHSQGCFR